MRSGTRITSSQHLLSACGESGRVTIGSDPPQLIRRLSDERRLTCPGCAAPVILHAGSVRAHHFAHLPGGVCLFPQTEPETEEHRSGKLLLAQWLRARVPQGEVTVEGFVPATYQRADILMTVPAPNSRDRTVALEYQCANLSAREWARRHALYRDAGIHDLWILGGSRCRTQGSAEATAGEDGGSPRHTVLRTGELERAMVDAGAPLLFLDARGLQFGVGTLARFRPVEGAQRINPAGSLSGRLLLELDFPWALLDWPSDAARGAALPSGPVEPAVPGQGGAAGCERLWLWLEQRFRITSVTLAPLFGVATRGQETILCEPRLWQAALYYRFIHQRVGSAWWLAEVETWARAYLPLTPKFELARLRAALRSTQDYFAAAGLLTVPVGYARSSARVANDLDTLPKAPDREEAMRIARYRRLVDR